jgi:baculoviral IAP repeat-containing protein 6
VTEVANMATSLPVGIFVKVSGTRPDIMKCLIMGPPDSPYGYGLFE